jgi:hypothetical protein
MAWVDHVSRRRWNWGAALVAVAALATNCGHSAMQAPTTPTSFNAVLTPTGAVTLSGLVTEGPPTTLTEIAGAVVSISDGVNAGKSTTADDYGLYTLTGLSSGRATITVNANGYVSASTTVELTENTTSNFQLTPAPQTVTDSLEGDIAAGDGTCSDGNAEYPCRIVVFPIHNSGPVEATLNWAGSASKLTMTLFQTDVAAPIARSTSSGANQEHIVATLRGGVDYEFHITFDSGTGSTTYTLRVTHMN